MYGEPTDVMPGPGKVVVLEERARLGQPLFHPRDALADDRHDLMILPGRNPRAETGHEPYDGQPALDADDSEVA